MRNDVEILPIKDLVDFEAQPFKVVDDEAMQELADSIKTAGVEVSYLDTKHQILLNDVIDYNCYEVNAKQGTQIKKHYLDGDLPEDKINEILKGEEIRCQGDAMSRGRFS